MMCKVTNEKVLLPISAVRFDYEPSMRYVVTCLAQDI